MTINARSWALGFAVMLGAAASTSAPAWAASPQDFYKGKTIYILVGNPPGGSYDFYARLAAEMLKAHIPGLGSVVVEDKPGGGGFLATADLFNEAPQDGTYLAVLPETMAQAQVLDPSSAKWKMQDFNMIGSFSPANSVFMLRKNAPVKNVEDMKSKQLIVGCTGNTAQSYQYPAMLKTLGGFKFKLVCGYRGAGDYTLALSRGEIDMVSSAWNSWRVTSMQQIKNGDLVPVIQAGLKRVKELPDVPLMQELVSDPDSKKAIEFAASSAPIGRALFATPGIPKDRVAYLRKTFDEMVADPAMIAVANKQRLLLDPTPGEQVQDEVRNIVNTPQSIVQKAVSAFK